VCQVGGKVEEAKGNVREHTTGLFSDQVLLFTILPPFNLAVEPNRVFC
jgi:hypothetical protein